MRQACLMFFLLLGVALAQGYKVQGEGFEVTFPVEAKKTGDTVWEADHGDNAYRMSVDSCDKGATETYAEAKAEFTREFKLVSESTGKVGGLPSQRFRFSLRDKYMDCVMVVRGDRLYMLAAISDGQQPEVERVLNSLHLR